MSRPQPTTARSQGRGGAGNMTTTPQAGVDGAALRTPTIKTATYTTGRGGSGNMATNDPANPAQARAAQDVDAPLAPAKEPVGTYHWGRGGEGNMVTVDGPNAVAAARGDPAAKNGGVPRETVQREEEKRRPALGKEGGSKERLGNFRGGHERRGSLQDVLERGKEMLGYKKEDKKGRESAVVDG